MRIYILWLLPLLSLTYYSVKTESVSVEVAKNEGEETLIDGEKQVLLGVDYEYVVNENDTVVLKCPIDVKEKTTATTRTSSTSGLRVNLELEDSESAINYDDASYEQNDLTEYDAEDEDDNDEFYDTEQHNRSKRDKLTVVQWFKESRKITKYKFSSRYELDGVYLRIRRFNANDSAIYKCKYINGFGTLTSRVNIKLSNSSSSSTTAKSILSSTFVSVTTQYMSTSTESRRKQKTANMVPVFYNPRHQPIQTYRKQKGSNVKFNCRAHAVVKPDIVWLKNGQILNEQVYGVTRSKWMLDLKDLRATDNGNFTCQVFNEYGSINATFQLIVYEDTQIFEGLDPLNSTITAGMDAVFTCKVKSSNPPNIKWMKQISKSEYKNYVIQSQHGDGLPESVEHDESPRNVDDVDDDDDDDSQSNDLMNNLFVLSTLPTLNVIEKQQHQADFLLDELTGSEEFNVNARADENGDEFKFELFMPSSNVPESKKNSNYRKPTVRKLASGKNDDSVHYITLSSPSIQERTTFNAEKNYYISQLIIKQTTVKDTGVYVCFGANSKGYSYRKSYLKVLPVDVRLLAGNQFNLFNKYQDLRQSTQNTPLVERKFENVFTIGGSSSLLGVQSLGYLIILIPILLIVTFAIASIFYLKKFDSNQEQAHANSNTTNNKRSFMGMFGRKGQNASKNTYCCCPTTIGSSKLIYNSYDDIEISKGRTTKASMPGTTSSLGSSLSESTTTATTVAYYATIPLLVDNGNLVDSCSPPPLPHSQPPTFSPKFTPDSRYFSPVSNELMQKQQHQQLKRVDSEQSIAYYKIVDSELIDQATAKYQKNSNQFYDANDDNATCVSSSSRFYYQLTPAYVDLVKNNLNNK